MDERDMRALLEEHLRELDWVTGVGKADLIGRVAYDEALRNLVGQYVPEGTYAAPDEVLTLIPEQAWQAAQGDMWRGGTIAAAGDVPSGFLEGQAGQDRPAGDGFAGKETEAGTNGDGLRARAGALAQGAAGAAERARHAAAQGRDQVLSISHKVGDTARPVAERLPHPPRLAVPTAPRPAVAVALSAVMEGLGQAYNRQGRKAVVFLATGLGLSTLSGLNTWLIQRVFRARDARFGPARVRGPLLAFWGATFAANLWDAWRTASRAATELDQSGGSPRPPATWGDVAAGGQPAQAVPPSQATDEFPTVG